jgi:hypothetical protein
MGRLPLMGSRRWSSVRPHPLDAVRKSAPDSWVEYLPQGFHLADGVTLTVLFAYNVGPAGDGKQYQRDIKFVVVPDIDVDDPLIRPRVHPFPLE